MSASAGDNAETGLVNNEGDGTPAKRERSVNAEEGDPPEIVVAVGNGTPTRPEQFEMDSSPTSPLMGEDRLHWSYYIYRPEDEEEDKKTIPRKRRRLISFKEASEGFRERASLVGFTQIHESFGVIKKVFWFFVLLLALGLLTYHMGALIRRYTSFNTVVQTQIKTFRRMRFPAVTVCNNNMIVNGGPGIGHGKNQDKYADFLGEYSQTDGHQFEDLVRNASFEGHPLTREDFTYVASAHFGNCYTFNKRGDYWTRRALPGYGLEMILNVESYKYNRNDAHAAPEFAGAVLKVHRHYTETIVEEGGIIVAPNTISRIALRQTNVTRLADKRYGNCTDPEDPRDQPKTYYSGLYTRENCLNTCLQREVMTRCCCYIKTMNRNISEFPETYNTCHGLTSEQKELYLKGKCPDCTNVHRTRFGGMSYCVESDSCWKHIWDLYDAGTIACDECYEECQETAYFTFADTARWPSDDHMNFSLVKELAKDGRLKNETKRFQLSIPFGDDAATRDFVRGNLLKVQMYFESMVTTYVTEMPAVADAEFVAEMESTAGFWIGWSMWTMFQFIEYLTDLLVILFRKVKPLLPSSPCARKD